MWSKLIEVDRAATFGHPQCLSRPWEAPTCVYPAKILFRAPKSAIILAWKVLSAIRLVTWSQNVTFRYIIWKNSPLHDIVWLILFLGQLTTFILFQASGVNSSQVFSRVWDVSLKHNKCLVTDTCKGKYMQSLRLIHNDFLGCLWETISWLVCRYEALRHKTAALTIAMLVLWCSAKIFYLWLTKVLSMEKDPVQNTSWKIPKVLFQRRNWPFSSSEKCHFQRNICGSFLRPRAPTI